MSSKKMVNMRNYSVEAYNFVGEHIEAYAELIGFWRWYPDIMFDFMRPETNSMSLDIDQRVYLRGLVRSKSVYGIYNRGYGKCVKKDTLIYTNKGIKEIGSFFNYQDDGVETEYNNLDIEVINREGRHCRVTKGVYSGKKPCLKIKTREGYELSGTYVHPVLTMGKDGALRYKRLEELQVGDYVCISRNNNFWGNKNKIDVSSKLNDWFQSLSPQAKHGLKVREMPSMLTPNLSLLLGYLVGDGCLTLRDRIGFSNIDKDIVGNFYLFMRQLFNSTNILQKNRVDYCVSDIYLRKYLEFLGLERCNAHYKEVPYCIMESSKENVASFLKGLFDTDGSVEKSAITYCTVSKKLSEQVQNLLLGFGIISKRARKVSSKGFECYVISITSENVDIFMKEIGFSCMRKQERGEKLTQKFHNTNIDFIPYQKERCLKLVDCGIFGDRSEIRKNILHVCTGEDELTYYRLRNKLFNKVGKIYPYLRENAEYKILQYYDKLHYHYSPVVSIENEGEQDVYDLQVDDMHSFISNGFVSHNTLVEVMAGFSCCMLYPGIRYAVTAQTKENAASVVGEKVNEILTFYPALNNEIADLHLAKNSAEVLFKNGSRLNILANSATSKGQRRERLAIEESVLVDNFTFLDALEPIVAVPRRTKGRKSVVDPKELNGQINFLSTAGFKGTSEYSRFLDMIDGMAEANGDMVLTADWKMSTWFGRGKTMAQIRNIKKTTPTNIFDQNYGSKWVGSTTGALVNYAQIQKIRTLDHSYLTYPNDGKVHEFYAGFDVARSERINNNQSALSIVEVFRDERGVVSRCDLVYLTLIPNTWETDRQATFVKKVCTDFKVVAIAADGNGVGSGVVDALNKPQTDEMGVTYGWWGSLNEAREWIPKDAPKKVYNMKAGSHNNPDVISNFISFIDLGKLRIMQPAKEEDFANKDDENLMTDIVPKKQTEEFITEVFNLKLVVDKKSLQIVQVDRNIDKDRYSCVAYVLWYIKNFAETLVKKTAMQVSDELKKALLGSTQPRKKYTPFGNRAQRTPFNNGSKRNFWGR